MSSGLCPATFGMSPRRLAGTLEVGGDVFAGATGDVLLVGEREAGGQLGEGDPRDVDGFVIGVVVDAELAAGCREEVVVHGLVDAQPVGGEPVGDGAEGGYGVAGDSGFFGDFASGCFNSGFTAFDVSLGQAPFALTGAVDSGDDGRGYYYGPVEVSDLRCGG